MDIYFVYPFSSQCITYYITSILNPALQGDLKPIKLQLSLLIDPLNNGQLHPFVRWCKTFVYGMKIAATLVICFFWKSDTQSCLQSRYVVIVLLSIGALCMKLKSKKSQLPKSLWGSRGSYPPLHIFKKKK